MGATFVVRGGGGLSVGGFAIALALGGGACGGSAPTDEAWTQTAGSTSAAASTSEGDSGPGSSGTDTSSIDESTSASDETTGDTGEPIPEGPARYPPNQTHSPITPYTAARMREIALLGPDKLDDVFMKTGASSTVSQNTLHCFADDPIELGEHGELLPSLEWFLGGDAAGTTPFDRETEAARVGHHAGWAIGGDPSPIDIEVDLLSPQIALVHFGTNDMGWGATYADALVLFHSNMMLMLDGLHDQGVVPIVFGITRRGDLSSAQRWVGTFNAAIRAMTQARQIPYIDLFHAIDPLPGNGLAGDGLHLEAYAGGACVLDDEGLEHGYNIRNLVALQALDRTRAVLVDEVDGIDPAMPPLLGQGTADDPWEVDALPFVDARDTSLDGVAMIDTYPGCDPDTDESGPEVWYRLEVDRPTAIRAFVLDMEGVDIDVHLIDDSATAEGCIARGHHQVQASLSPGTYYLSLDSWTSGGVPQAGAFEFVIVECDDDDSACQ